MSERKLIVCNPSIFFEDHAPAAYPYILSKLSPELGVKAYELQAKYEAGKSDGPGFLPEMAELFRGIESINMACRQYCWEYGRREVFEIFRRFNDRGHRCMLVTSLPQEICTEFTDLTRMIGGEVFIASQVLVGSKYEPLGANKDVYLYDRNTRKETALASIEHDLAFRWKHVFVGWENVLFIGQSLTDIPLGKAVKEKGGRFIAFHLKNTDIIKVVDHAYGDTCTLERAFSYERLLLD